MTRAEHLAELQTERTRLKTAISTAQSGASSTSIDGMSVTQWRTEDLRKELIRVEKSIQRLCRGGRGMPIDMNIGAGGDAERTFDPLTGNVLYG
jgi:hypothetical protein